MISRSRPGRSGRPSRALPRPRSAGGGGGGGSETDAALADAIAALSPDYSWDMTGTGSNLPAIAGAFDATLSGSPATPSEPIGNLTGYLGAGASSWLPGFSLSPGGFAVFCVVKAANVGTQQVIWHEGNSDSNGCQFGISAAGQAYVYVRRNSSSQGTTNFGAVSNDDVLTFTYIYGANPGRGILNGVAADGVLNYSVSTGGGFRIGGTWFSGVNKFRSGLTAVAVWKTAIPSEADLIALHAVATS